MRRSFRERKCLQNCAGIGWGIMHISLFLMSCTLFMGCSLGRLDQVLIKNIPAQMHQINAVQIIRENQFTDPQLKMELKQGDEIKTDSESTAIIWLQGGSRIILGPDTHIRLVNPNHIIDLLSSIGEKISTLFIEAKGALQVNTEYVSAASEGTEFYLTLGPKNDMSLTVLEGAVRVQSKQGLFSPVRVERFHKAIVKGAQPATVDPISRDKANTIIELINHIERIGYTTNAQLLLPDVRGLQIHEGDRVLKEAGFTVREKAGRITGREPVGTIIDQSPAAGTRMQEGSSVLLYFEAKSVNVPPLVGLPRQRAIEALSLRGLLLGNVREKMTGTVRTDMVIEQEPPAGTPVPEGSKVNVVIEAESVRVPDVVGMDIGQAKERLSVARLRTGRVTEKITGSARIGHVIGQDPSQGNLVKPGTSVNLMVEARSAVMPNLVNLPIEEARYLISGAQLSIRRERTELTEKYKPGMVIMQSIPAETRVQPGTVVDLTVAEAGIRVPHLENQNLNEADQLLERLGLRRKISWTQNSRYSPDSIISQQPQYGTLARKGDVVYLEVAKRVEQCNVPNLMGLAEAQAMETLRKSGFRGKPGKRSEPITAYGSSFSYRPIENSVVQQNPPANETAPCGSEIEFWIYAPVKEEPKRELQLKNPSPDAGRFRFPDSGPLK